MNTTDFDELCAELAAGIEGTTSLVDIRSSSSIVTIYTGKTTATFPQSCGNVEQTSFVRATDIPPHYTCNIPNKKLRGGTHRWKAIDEIFLTGIVMDTYRRRHSLKPYFGESRKERGETQVWKDIQQRFEVARRRHRILTGQTLTPRTALALQKRWKLVDRAKENRRDEFGCFYLQVSSSKRKEMLWDTRYNVKNLLTCPETVFSMCIVRARRAW